MTDRPGQHPFRGIAAPKFAGSSISLLRLDREKRRHYRVAQATLPELVVSVPYSDGSERLGHCRDVSVGGVSVSFDSGQDPGLEAGDEIVLLFRTESQERTISVAARVVARRWMDHDGIVYAFVFTRPDELRSQVWGAWGRWFNRRRFRRYVPDRAKTVLVQIQWPRGMLDARLVDVSLGGLAVAVKREEAAQLASARDVHVSFGLGDASGNSTGLRFRAIVRSCSANPREARVGLEFLRDETYDRSGPELQRWIERRVPTAEGKNG